MTTSSASPSAAPLEGSRRASFLLGTACSNDCVFCAQRGMEGALPTTPEALASLRASGASAITFVGGEPLLDLEALERVVRAARDAGFVAVGVQTNGAGLAAAAPRLAAAGLTDVHVSLHGADAAVHDYHAGRAGRFDALWEGLARARAARLTTVATTVLTRSNFRVLGAIPLALRARGVDAWHVAVPLARGRAAASFDRVMPRLALALPFALHALDAARKLGLPAYVSGAPLCLLGPLATRVIDAGASAHRAFHDDVCGSCPARAACPGVDPTYLRRFGGDELRPRADAPRGAEGEPLASLFTGIGAVAGEVAREVPTPSREARRHLPLLGRPNRGAQEASSRGAKTGEALREILPALFTPPSTPSDEEP